MKMKKAKRSLFSDILGSVTKYFVILVVIVLVVIAFSGLRVIKSGEVAVVLRFGRLVGNTYEEQVHQPGLLFAFPYIIDEVVIVPTGNVIEQKVMTHYTNGEMTTLHNNGYLITGDQNIAMVSASVKYMISDPVSYALNVKDASALINAFVSSAMVNSAASTGVDELLTSGKDEFAKAVLNEAQEKLSAVDSGITVGAIELTSVSMPNEVREVYDMVNSATVQAATLLEQARQYEAKVIPQAEADAATLVSDAKKKYSESVSAANLDLTEFYGTVKEYEENPDAVKTRVYTEKVTAAIGKIGKIRVVKDGETKIFLPTGGK